MITTKLEGYLIALVALLVIVGGGAFYFYHKGKANELAAAKVENARITQAANERIAALTGSYNTALKGIEDSYDKDVVAASQQHADDLSRLRAATAHQGNPVLRGPASPQGKQPDPYGTGSAAGLDDVFVRSDVSLALADALREDDDLLAVCRAERSSLTGK